MSLASLIPGTARPAGQCPQCGAPTLAEVDLHTVDDCGVTFAGTWVGCSEDDCAEGTT